MKDPRYIGQPGTPLVVRPKGFGLVDAVRIGCVIRKPRGVVADVLSFATRRQRTCIRQSRLARAVSDWWHLDQPLESPRCRSGGNLKEAAGLLSGK
jgi:hypothetical protein